MRHEELANQQCSILRPLSILGDRWTLVVLRQAFAGVRRFEHFQSTLGISRSRLSDRLGRLVEQGILERVPYRDQRVRFEYRLTDKGLDLYPVLMALRVWGDKYMSGEGGPPLTYRHRGCGGVTGVAHQCQRCGQELTARDVEVRDAQTQAARYKRRTAVSEVLD